MFLARDKSKKKKNSEPLSWIPKHQIYFKSTVSIA